MGWARGGCWLEGLLLAWSLGTCASDQDPSSAHSAVFDVAFQQVLMQKAAFEVDDTQQQLVVKRVTDSSDQTCAHATGAGIANEQDANQMANQCADVIPVAETDRLLSVDGQRVSLLDFQQVIDSAPGTSHVLPLFKTQNDEFILTGFVRVEVFEPERLQFRATSTSRQQEVQTWLLEQETRRQRELENRRLQEEAQREQERLVQDQIRRKEIARMEQLALQQAREQEARKQRMTPHHEVPNLRRMGQEFRYEVVFTTKGPIGLNWDLQTTSRTVVSHLENNMVAANQNVIQPKDQLIQLNDINTTLMGPYEVVEEYLKAQVPRRMVFLCARKQIPAPSTAAAVTPGQNTAAQEGFALTFESPAILKGWTIELVLAPWSAINETKLFSKAIPLLGAVPSDACTSLEAALSAQRVARNAREQEAFLSYRGVCSFTDKALQVQNANGDLLVIVNNVKGDPQFPQAIPSLDNIHIPITMISKEEGDFVLSVLDHEQEAVVVVNRRNVTSKELSIVDISKMSKEELSIVRDPVRGATQLQFRFLNLSESASHRVNLEQFTVLPALFGAKIPSNVPFRLVMAYPMETACHPQGLRILTTRAIVLAKRGGCSFAAKLKAIQDVGAMGMIMINTDASLLPLMSDPREAQGLTIWTATINHSDGTHLEEILLQNKNLPSLVKIIDASAPS